MPFGDITVNSKTFQPRLPGIYSLSTVTFGDPANEFSIRGGVPTKDQVVRASVMRRLQKDVSVGSVISRRDLMASLSIIVPAAGFTASEIDVLTSDISEFMTVNTITRLLSGES